MDEIRISATMYCEYISCKHKNYVFLKNFKFLLLSSTSSQQGKKGLTNSNKLGTLLSSPFVTQTWEVVNHSQEPVATKIQKKKEM